MSVREWVEAQAAAATEGRAGGRRLTVGITAASYETLSKVASAIGRSKSRCAEELLDRAIREAWQTLEGGGLASAQSHSPQSTQHSSATLHVPYEESRTLADLQRLGEDILGCKPQRLTFPDGSTAWTPEWKDVDREVVRWLGERYPLPVPFRIAPTGGAVLHQHHAAP